MAVIGVLAPHGAAEIEVEALHVNFWALTTPFTAAGAWEYITRLGSLKTFLDIGIRFKIIRGTVSSLTMLIPRRLSRDDDFLDLSSLVLDENLNDLIFGVVTKTVGTIIKYDLFGTAVSDDVLGISDFRRNGAELRLITERPVDASDQIYYVRFRMACRRKSEMFFAKGWGLAKQGYIFRCLINDIRGTSEIRQSGNVADRLLQVKVCYTFLVAHSSFVPVLASPALYYSRLLEASVWRAYLASCGAIRSSHTYTIHQWRSTADISLSAPFRAYGHLHREFGPRMLLFYLIGLASPVAFNFVVASLKSLGLWHLP